MKYAVSEFQAKYRDAFRELNLEWIAKYFKVEKKDLEQVSHPEACIASGGQIFFVVHDGQAIATCALYPVSKGIYELAKMAVAPAFHGQGLGNFLMTAAEDWARARNAQKIMMLSNTILEPAINLYHKHGYKTVHLGPHPDYERCNIELEKVLSSAKE